MFVIGQLGAERVDEHAVCNLPHVVARLVQYRQHACVLLLDQVTDDLVVEVLNLMKTTTAALRDQGHLQ